MADGITTLVIVLADVIAKWQMEWPLQGGVLADVILIYIINYRCYYVIGNNISQHYN